MYGGLVWLGESASSVLPVLVFSIVSGVILVFVPFCFVLWWLSLCWKESADVWESGA